jgi:hypothetical protein
LVLFTVLEFRVGVYDLLLLVFCTGTLFLLFETPGLTYPVPLAGTFERAGALFTPPLLGEALPLLLGTVSLLEGTALPFLVGKLLPPSYLEGDVGFVAGLGDTFPPLFVGVDLLGNVLAGLALGVAFPELPVLLGVVETLPRAGKFGLVVGVFLPVLVG